MWHVLIYNSNRFTFGGGKFFWVFISNHSHNTLSYKKKKEKTFFVM